MNINLGQANGVCLSKWQMWALKHLAGAEAPVNFAALMARLKPCTDTKPTHAVPFRARPELA
jgi:hypothetical protein